MNPGDQVDDFTLTDETGARPVGIVADEKVMNRHADEALAILRRREAA
jgi:hypothetical protein